MAIQVPIERYTRWVHRRTEKHVITQAVARIEGQALAPPGCKAVVYRDYFPLLPRNPAATSVCELGEFLRDFQSFEEWDRG